MSKLIFSHCTCEDLQFTHCIRLRVDKTENLWYCHKKATLMTFSDKILRTWLIVLPTKMEALRKSLDCHSPCVFHSVWKSFKKVSNDIFQRQNSNIWKRRENSKIEMKLNETFKGFKVIFSRKIQKFQWDIFWDFQTLCFLVYSDFRRNLKNQNFCLYVCLIDFCLVLALDFGSKKLVKL